MSIKKKLVVIIICISSFLCMIDTTIMVVSLPKIQSYMNVPLSRLSWTLNAYTIIFAVFTILLSRLAEIKGKNKVFILGLIIFTIGSYLSGHAQDCNFLIISRGIQGFGAAIILPLSMVIAISLVDTKERHKVIGILGGIQGLGAAIGPVLGGIISQYLGWRWIFFINIPFLIVVIGISLYTLKLKNEEKIKDKLDLAGAVLSMIFLFALTLGLIKGNDWRWTSFPTISLFIVAIVALVLFIICEKIVAKPMINLNLFKSLEFDGAAIIFILVNFFLVGVTVVIPTYLTKVQNSSELTAALLITPISLTIAIIIPIASLFIKKIKSKYFIFTGFIVIGIGYYLLSKLQVSKNYNELILIDILLGFGAGLLIAASNILIASDFKGELLTASQSVGNVLRQFGIILVVSIFLTVLTANINNAQNETVAYGNRTISKFSISNEAKSSLGEIIEKNLQGNKINQSNNKENLLKQEKFLKPRVYEEIEVAIKEIKIFEKNKVKNAFLDLYKYTYPFVFLSAFTFIIFQIVEKKKIKKI